MSTQADFLHLSWFSSYCTGQWPREAYKNSASMYESYIWKHCQTAGMFITRQAAELYLNSPREAWKFIWHEEKYCCYFPAFVLQQELSPRMGEDMESRMNPTWSWLDLERCEKREQNSSVVARVITFN